MKKTLVQTGLAIAFSFMVFGHQIEGNAKSQESTFKINQMNSDKNTFVSIFEIPALEIFRAVSFYESILDIKIETMEMPGMKMGLFPYENQAVFGTIVQGEEFVPSANGVTIYLSGGKDLQVALDRVEESGGRILLPKTAHLDESGYFALFLDTEGNKMGLHSPE